MTKRKRQVLVIGSQGFAKNVASLLGRNINVLAKPSFSLEIFLDGWQPDLVVVNCDDFEYGAATSAGLAGFHAAPPVFWVSSDPLRARVIGAASIVVHPTELRQRLTFFARALRAQTRAAQNSPVELPLGGVTYKVPVGSHVAYLWETKADLDALKHFCATASTSETLAFIVQSKSGRSQPLPDELSDVTRALGLATTKNSKNIFLQTRRRDVMTGKFGGAFFKAISSLITTQRASLVRVIGVDDNSRPRNFDKHVPLLEESLNTVLPNLPAVMLCLYQVSKFSAPQLMKGVLETHPVVIYQNKLHLNQFYPSRSSIYVR
jgi:hypothetical protein